MLVIQPYDNTRYGACKEVTAGFGAYVAPSTRTCPCDLGVFSEPRTAERRRGDPYSRPELNEAFNGFSRYRFHWDRPDGTPSHHRIVAEPFRHARGVGSELVLVVEDDPSCERSRAALKRHEFRVRETTTSQEEIDRRSAFNMSSDSL